VGRSSREKVAKKSGPGRLLFLLGGGRGSVHLARTSTFGEKTPGVGGKGDTKKEKKAKEAHSCLLGLSAANAPHGRTDKKERADVKRSVEKEVRSRKKAPDNRGEVCRSNKPCRPLKRRGDRMCFRQSSHRAKNATEKKSTGS